MGFDFGLRLASCNLRTRASWTLLLLLLAPHAASAQRQYCAQRSVVQPTNQCFTTLAEAEAFIRAEPAPEKGYQFLEQSMKPTQTLLGKFSLGYVVKPRRYDAFFGDWYVGYIVATGHSVDCGRRVPLSSPIQYGCDDEQELSNKILEGYPYYGSWSGTYLGEYAPMPPLQWSPTAVDQTTQRSYVSMARNTLPASARRRLVATNGAGTMENSISRTDFYRCPRLFSGTSNSSATWPMVCANSVTASIVVQSSQYKSACDGNPCVPATGNKEYRETDFEWEGQAFTRAYNSLGELPPLSGLSENWAHTFSERLLLRSNVTADMYWIRSDGYFEAFSQITDTTYFSRNHPGTVLYKETDSVAATHGRWRVAQGSDRKLWFNESGRLSRIEDGTRAFSLTYCTSADVVLAACPSTNELKEVVSGTGRKLSFEHEEVVIGSGTEAGDVRLGARLRRIKMDGRAVAEYLYDSSGRLVKAALGDPALGEGRQYLYGEATAICRDGLGAEVTPCAPSSFANALTGVIDEAGSRYASYTYDQHVRVTSSEHAGGAGRVSLLYQTNGDVNVTLPLGATKTYQFASGAFRKPTSVRFTSPQGSALGTSTYTYTNFRPASQLGPTGAMTKYVYDTFRETSRTEGLTSTGATTPETRTIQTDWHADLNTPTERRTYNVSNVLVARTSWTYNARGQLLVHTEHDPVTGSTRARTMAYCEQADVADGTCPLVGLLKSVDGPRTDVDDVATYSYYANDEAACASTPGSCLYRKGDLWKVTNALGHVTEYLTYDSAGRARAIKDHLGNVVEHEYNDRGWATATNLRVNGEIDSVTRTDYSPTGSIKRVTQPDGSYVAYDYDAAHRLVAVSDSAGNRIDYTLDNAGNRTAENVKDPGGTLKRQLARAIDALGRAQQTVGRE